MQGFPFSQPNLYVVQPLSTLMMNTSAMAKPIVAQGLLAGAHGVRLLSFLFLFNSDCLGWGFFFVLKRRESA